MFSIIIPLYNKELSIESTIQSVLNQSFEDFELIIVNDGSVDNSMNVVKRIKDNRIRLINQTNKGVSAARNTGVRKAKYKWVAFLDADDLWKENHLAEIIRMMRVFPNEKVYATSFEFSDGRYMYRHPRDTDVFKIADYFTEALRENLICTDIVVVDRDCFLAIGGFQEKLSKGEDLDLWARLAREYDIVKSSRITALYRIDAENRSNASLNLERTRVFHYDFSQATSEEERRYYRDQIIKSLRRMIKKKEFKSFLRLYNRHSEYISLIGVLRGRI